MIIGLTGKKQSGKNTVASLIASLTMLPVIQVSFAAKLKQSAAAALGITIEEIERGKNDPQCIIKVFEGCNRTHLLSMRAFLQRYGTEAHRQVFGEDFWLNVTLPLDKSYDDALYVVTDVRFVNEAVRVRELGGKIVHVIGPPKLEDAIDNHASEIPLPDDLVDYHLYNKYDIQDCLPDTERLLALENRIALMLKEILVL